MALCLVAVCVDPCPPSVDKGHAADSIQPISPGQPSLIGLGQCKACRTILDAGLMLRALGSSLSCSHASIVMSTGTLDFLVIGAMKGGTTSLFEYLRTHPELYLPAAKDVPFFCQDGVFERGWD